MATSGDFNLAIDTARPDLRWRAGVVWSERTPRHEPARPAVPERAEQSEEGVMWREW